MTETLRSTLEKLQKDSAGSSNDAKSHRKAFLQQSNLFKEAGGNCRFIFEANFVAKKKFTVAESQQNNAEEL